MDISYSVHSAAVQPFDTVATLADGRKVSATVQGVVVELVSADGTMTHTLKFIPDDLDAALAAFPVGGTIGASFVKTADPVAPEPETPAAEPPPASPPPPAAPAS